MEVQGRGVMNQRNAWDWVRAIAYVLLVVVRPPLRYLATLLLLPLAVVALPWGLFMGVFNFVFFSCAAATGVALLCAVRYDTLLDLVKPAGLGD
jgi:uncharacterized membrane protein YvlD (DUF360 family)